MAYCVGCGRPILGQHIQCASCVASGADFELALDESYALGVDTYDLVSPLHPTAANSSGSKPAAKE